MTITEQFEGRLYSQPEVDALIAEAEKLAVYNYRANILSENYATELGTYDYDGIAEMVLDEPK